MDGRQRRLMQFRVATLLGSSVIAVLLSAVLWVPITAVAARVRVPHWAVRVTVPESPPPEICPVCGAPVVRLDQVVDDLTKPSRNLSAWNRSSCGFGRELWSVICVRDWYAYSPKLKQWSLSLNDSSGFAIELDTRIRDFPLPEKSAIRSGVVYSQDIDEQVTVHSVGFWCDTDEDYLSKLAALPPAITIEIERDRLPSQSIVHARLRRERR